MQACSRSVDPAIAGDTTGNDPRASNPSAFHALERPAARRKRLGAALHGTASSMGTRARLGGNRRMPANRLFRPIGISTVLNSDFANLIPAKPPSGATEGLRTESMFPPNAGFEGVARPLSNMLTPEF